MISAKRLVLLLFVVSILGGMATGAKFYYHLGYFWGFVLLSSWLLARQSLIGVEVQRSVRTQRSQVGRIFEERFEIINKNRLPRIWLEVRDHSTLPQAHASQVLSFIGGRESRSYLVRTRLISRGVYPLGPTTIKSGDLLGLFPTNKDFAVQNSVLVYPTMVDINVFPSPAGWLSGGEAIRRRTHQITPNAAGVREYAPGDPLNRIHWLSTARRNRIIVKEFELDPLSEVWIFLDASKHSQAMKPYEHPVFEARDQWRPMVKVPMFPATIEYGVTIAASLARYFLKNGRAVGFLSLGHQLTSIPSDRGSRQLGKILDSLALLRGEGDLAIQGLVEAQSHNIPRGSTVVLISSAVGRNIPLAVEILNQRGFKAIVVLLRSESFEGRKGSDDVAAILTSMKIVYYQISEGEDIGNALSRNSYSLGG